MARQRTEDELLSIAVQANSEFLPEIYLLPLARGVPSNSQALDLLHERTGKHAHATSWRAMWATSKVTMVRAQLILARIWCW